MVSSTDRYLDEVDPVFNLLVVREATEVGYFQTSEKSFTVGRSADCGLVLSDRKASRIHGEFFFTRCQAVYRDLMSHNGTRVDTGGKTVWLGPLVSEWHVNEGDRLFIGDSIIEVVSTSNDIDSTCQSIDVSATLELEQHASSSQHDADLSMDTLSRLMRFCELPSYDVSSVRQTKQSLLTAVLEVLPNADCVSFVNIKKDAKTALRHSDIEQHSKIFLKRSNDDTSIPDFDFDLLSKSFRSRRIVCQNAKRLSTDDDRKSRNGRSLICAPLYRKGEITGFLYCCTSNKSKRGFSSPDVQLLTVLSSLASLLVNQSYIEQERAKVRTMASVGQVVASLSHDANSILGCLGMHANLLENTHPELLQNESWLILKDDLDFIRFIVRDARDRISIGDKTLYTQAIPLRELIDGILERCRRYFLNEVQASRFDLINFCDSHVEVHADPRALSVVVMNCVKNSMDAYQSNEKQSETHSERLSISISHRRKNGQAMISVQDKAGGIPCNVLSKLGNTFVSTKGDKGMGLGLNIVTNLVERMSGHVRVSTSTEPREGFTAGTIVSIGLGSPDSEGSTESKRPVFQINSNYELECKRLEQNHSLKE